MTLGQLHERLCLRGREPIGRALRPGAVLRQRTLEGRERAVAPFIEDTTAHPETGRHVGDGLAAEQREDGLEAVFPGGRIGSGVVSMGASSSCRASTHHGNFVEHLECEIPAGPKYAIAGFFPLTIEENAPKCVLHPIRRNLIRLTRSSWTP
jgi:hypothetical protein